jgi:AhpD family alkylhydroperoxidase
MNTAIDDGRLPEHLPRMDLASVAPEVVDATLQLTRAAHRDVDPTVVKLVEIRASQLNKCAFCLDMHTKSAVAAGESVERIVQLSAWEESRHFYTAREIAAIELTEAMTLLPRGPVPDEVYDRAAKQFDETELAHLIAAITVINAWNRLMVTTRAVPRTDPPAPSR